MTDYRSILRLHSQGHSQRSMERELNCSRHTISEILVQAAAAGLKWPLEDASNGRYDREKAVEIREAARRSIGSKMPAKSLELRHTIQFIREMDKLTR